MKAKCVCCGKKRRPAHLGARLQGPDLWFVNGATLRVQLSHEVLCVDEGLVCKKCLKEAIRALHKSI